MHPFSEKNINRKWFFLQPRQLSYVYTHTRTHARTHAHTHTHTHAHADAHSLVLFFIYIVDYLILLKTHGHILVKTRVSFLYTCSLIARVWVTLSGSVTLITQLKNI